MTCLDMCSSFSLNWEDLPCHHHVNFMAVAAFRSRQISDTVIHTANFIFSCSHKLVLSGNTAGAMWKLRAAHTHFSEIHVLPVKRLVYNLMQTCRIGWSNRGSHLFLLMSANNLKSSTCLARFLPLASFKEQYVHI